MNDPVTASNRLRSSALFRRMADERFLYVIVNLTVNLLVLVRSYVFLLVLDYRDLGLITLLQSIVLLLGMLQFGVINGAYRLFLSAAEEEKQDLVDFVFSFIAVLCAIAMVIAGFALLLIGRFEDGMIGLFGVIGGAASLVRNWQSNLMIAEQRLTVLNIINLGTALAALAFFALLPVSPLIACMAVVVSQPILFAVLAAFVRGLRNPRRFGLSKRLGKSIIATGFMIFLSGMMLQLNIQMERWYVLAELGVDALGHLFIAIMVLSLLQLVPTALDAVFLPSSVRAHQDGDPDRLAATMRTYLMLLVGYVLIAAFALAWLAEPVLTLLAPRYVEDLVYAYLLAPGALLLVVSAAFALTFSVLIRYRYLLTAYATGSGALAIVFAIALADDVGLSLEGVMIARTLGLGLTALLVVAGWWVVTRGHQGLRFTRNAVIASPSGDNTD